MAGPSWVQYKPGDGYSYDARTSGLTPDELLFCENRERATTLAESRDPNSSYGYDDYALAELDGVYYAFNTSGCYCPDPSEAWGLIFKGDREGLLAFLADGGGSEAWNEFLREVEKAGITLASPAPAPSSNRYHW